MRINGGMDFESLTTRGPLAPPLVCTPEDLSRSLRIFSPTTEEQEFQLSLPRECFPFERGPSRRETKNQVFSRVLRLIGLCVVGVVSR